MKVYTGMEQVEVLIFELYFCNRIWIVHQP